VHCLVNTIPKTIAIQHGITHGTSQEGYATANARCTITVTFGRHHYWRLCYIDEVIYQDPQGRVNFVRETTPKNYFEIEGISYDMNTDQVQWRTTYTLRELTTYSAPTQTIPPTPSVPRVHDDI
jgi:hypothetical protein